MSYWKFWRWRPKVSLGTLLLLAICTASCAALQRHWVAWQIVYTGLAVNAPKMTVALASDLPDVTVFTTENSAILWDNQSGTSRAFTAQQTITGAALSPGGQRMVGVDSGGTFYVWDAMNGAALAAIGNSHLINAGACFYSADGKRVLVNDWWLRDSIVWERCHPEAWWGRLCLPEFWLTLISSILLLRSLLKDFRTLRRAGFLAQPTSTSSTPPRTPPQSVDFR